MTRRQTESYEVFFRTVADCIGNIFIASTIEDVVWGESSVLNAQLNCMFDLLNYHAKVQWHYVINLNGLELPLRTNYEIVEILKSHTMYSLVSHSQTTWILNDFSTKLVELQAYQ